MKIKIRFLFFFLCFHSILSSQVPEKNILFIGNSITYFNDMPILFKNIANNKGKNVVTEMYAPGGTGFVNHVEDANVYNAFRSRNWDAVVLQPGSSESPGVSWPVQTTIQRGQKLIDSIHKYSPCAKVFLYQIPYGVRSSDGINGDYNNYQTIQTKIKDSIAKLADGLRIPIVASGECARAHYSAQQNLLLHGSFNDIHPNLNGSYLVASAMFTTIFQENVSGTTYYGGISQATAEYFHGIVDTTILPNKPEWRINTYNLYSNFSNSIHGNLVDFTHNATNYDTLEWDFGDGTTSSIDNPSHQYTSGGIKTVRLKAIKGSCQEIFEKQIDLGVLSNEEYPWKEIILQPNPAKDAIHVTLNNASSLSIINVLGQILLEKREFQKEWDINISSLQDGVYFLITKDKKAYKFLKK